MLTSSQQLANCPFVERDQSSPCPHTISCGLLLILSYHLCLCLPSGFLSSDFPIRTLYSLFIFPYTRCMPRPPQPALFHHLNNIWYRAQITKLLIMQSSPFPYYFVPHRPKYESSSVPYSRKHSAYAYPSI